MTGKRVRSDENVFEALGFAPDEAENLRVRATLMSAATRLIRARGLKQKDAAKLFGTTQPRVSELLRGHIDEFTIDSLVNMLAHAGAQVQLSIEFHPMDPRR